MDETCFFKHRQSVQELRRKDFDELSAEALELVLFDEFVKVR